MVAFLSLRGHCLLAEGKVQEGLEAHETALRLSPNSLLQKMIASTTVEKIRSRMPLSFLPPEARVPGLPRSVPVIIFPGSPADQNPLAAIRNIQR